MFKEMSKYYLVAGGCFLLGTMFLMLNVLSGIFNLLFAILISVGLALIAVKKIVDYRIFKNELTLTKEGLAVDMTLSSDGTFEMKDTVINKKQLKQLNALKREKFTPILVTIALFLMMAFLTYRLIKGYF